MFLQTNIFNIYKRLILIALFAKVINQSLIKLIIYMQTREKFGSQAKKMLKIMIDLKDFNAYKLLQICKEQVMPDIKKLIDLIFIFEGLGLITRYSKKNFVYSGLRGTVSRVIEMIICDVTKTQQLREHWLYSEEYQFENKRYPLRQSVYHGLLYQEMLGRIFSQQSRTLQRDSIEKALEKLSLYFQMKEMNSNLIINDMTSLMTALNFLDRKTQPDLKMEAYESYQWIGPDLFAPFNTDQLNPCSVDLKQQIEDKIILNYEKEQNYFQTLFRDLGDDVRMEVETTQKQSLKQPVMLFPPVGYALLKGKHSAYFIKKLSIIIGRQNHSKGQKYQWDVDYGLDSSAKVSKQHAVIEYNQSTEQFEISCISNKKSIVVDQTEITKKDKPQPLRHRSFIQIGKKHLTFYLPKNEPVNQDQTIEID